jgi:hypothetical protein
MTPKQVELSKKIGMSIQSGNGCHAKGTPILMYDGTTKLVEDVEVGDLLMGDDSTPRRVLSLARGREPMYRVLYKNGNWYDVNENHILSLRFLAEKGTRGRKKGDVVNVPLREYLGWSEKEKFFWRGYKVGVDFPAKDLPIPPYILGLWLGDGCKVTTSLVTRDEEVVNEWEKYAKSLGLKVTRNPNGKEFVITGECLGGKPNAFREKLRQIGVWGNKHIPHDYLTGSREQRLELLAGLIDTDGHLSQYNRRNLSIIQKRHELAKQIVYLCRSLGFNANISPKIKTHSHKGERKSNIYYEVCIGRGHVEEIPVRLERKKPIAVPNGLALNFGFTIHSLGEDDYYGFTVDGNHLYVMGDFTVTHNCGKDFMASIFTWHFMTCFSYARGMATANTGKQLTNVFWSALADIRSLALKPDPNNPESLNILQENFELQSEKLFAKLPNKDDRGKRWFCEAVTINTKASAEEQGEALAGRHADHMIVVVDEASGIPDAVFKPIDRTLTGKLNLCFMIFNPTSNTGFAIDSQTKNREMWIPLHWDAMSSDNVPRSQIERLKRYGEDSPAYRIGVLGLPPLVDGNTLIPYDWIRAAIGRELEVGDHDPVMMGADIGAGGDRSVVCLRKGGKVLDFKRSSNPNTPDLADWIGATMDEEDAAVCFVDNIGVGWGVFTTLQKMRYTVRAADSRKSSDNERFLNKRAEIYWKLREQFEHGLISLPEPVDEGDDNDPIVCLARELGAIRNEVTGKKEKILDKKDIRRAIGFSPDHADALMMSYFKPDSLFRKAKGKNANSIDYTNVYMW